MTGVVLHPMLALPNEMVDRLRAGANQMAVEVTAVLEVETSVVLGETWEELNPPEDKKPLGLYVQLDKSDENLALYNDKKIHQATANLWQFLRTLVPYEFRVAIYSTANPGGVYTD